MVDIERPQVPGPYDGPITNTGARSAVQPVVRALCLSPDEQAGRIAGLLIEGLTTDGAHHKQWCMEQALMVFFSPEWVETTKAFYSWDDGIEP